MIFESIYALHLTKIEKKGRTQVKLDQMIRWLTGFDGNQIQKLLDNEATFKIFFEQAKRKNAKT